MFRRLAYLPLLALLGAADADVPQARPDRPSVATSAFTTERGALELELGGVATEQTFGMVSTLKLGVLDGLDVRVNFAPTFHPDFAVDTLGLQLKWRVVAPDDGKLGFAISPFYGQPIYESDPVSLGVIFAVTYPFADGFELDGNLIFDTFLDAEDAIVLTPVVNLGFPIAGALSGYGELYLVAGCTVGGDGECHLGRVGAGAGVAYALRPNVILDAAIDFDVTGEDPLWIAQLGLTGSIFVF